MIDKVIYCAQTVYNEMGAGHSENIYEACMALEISFYDTSFFDYKTPVVTRQVPCPLKYKGLTIGVGYIDLLVDNLIVELKAVAKLTPKDVQQVRKYLQAMDLENGLLINFGTTLEIVEVKGSYNEQTISTED